MYADFKKKYSFDHFVEDLKQSDIKCQIGIQKEENYEISLNFRMKKVSTKTEMNFQSTVKGNDISYILKTILIKLLEIYTPSEEIEQKFDIILKSFKNRFKTGI